MDAEIKWKKGSCDAVHSCRRALAYLRSMRVTDLSKHDDWLCAEQICSVYSERRLKQNGINLNVMTGREAIEAVEAMLARGAQPDNEETLADVFKRNRKY